MHQREPRAPVQWFGLDAELAEVVEDVRLDALQTRFCSLVPVGFDAEREVLVLNEAIVTALELVLQHGAVLSTQAVVLIAAQGDGDAITVGFFIRGRVDKAELKTDRSVKVIEKVAPAVEDGVLVLVLR